MPLFLIFTVFDVQCRRSYEQKLQLYLICICCFIMRAVVTVGRCGVIVDQSEGGSESIGASCQPASRSKGALTAGKSSDGEEEEMGKKERVLNVQLFSFVTPLFLSFYLPSCNQTQTWSPLATSSDCHSVTTVTASTNCHVIQNFEQQHTHAS